MGKVLNYRSPTFLLLPYPPGKKSINAYRPAEAIDGQVEEEEEEEVKEEEGEKEEEKDEAQEEVKEEAVEKEEEEEEEIGFEANSAQASPIPQSTPLPEALTPLSVQGTPIPSPTPAPHNQSTAAGGRRIVSARRQLFKAAEKTPDGAAHDDNG